MPIVSKTLVGLINVNILITPNYYDIIKITKLNPLKMF